MGKISNFKRKIRRRLHELVGSDKYSHPGLGGIDRELEKHLNFTSGFFIEAGANDGYSQSNTYYLERFKGWRGVLVEGMPELFQKCKKERPRSKVYHCALVSNTCTDKFIEMRYANLMSLVKGAMKNQEMEDRHIEDGLRVKRLPATYTVQVPARTLESILDEQPDLPQIDLLSLDVEGYELEVLQGMNLARYKPRYILVEARFFDAINEFLSTEYEMVAKMSHHDFLYHLKSDVSSLKKPSSD